MNANMTAPRCLVAAIDADLRFRLTSRSRENGSNRVSSGTRCRPGGSLSGPPRLFLIERDTDPTRLSPDNATMMIAVLCIDNQVE
jgi:hypothetical protein